MSKIKLLKLQRKTLGFFGQHSFGNNFYWTGGTLLAYYYLHHRVSIDLDFFSDNLFTDDEYLIFLNILKKELNLKKIVANQQYNRRLYQLEDEQDKIKLELVYFPFPAMEKRKKIPEFSLTIDSLTDIMVNKILSTYQRNEVKDVFDLYIYFLLFCKKFSLPQLISLVEKKFGLTLELSILLTKINELCDQANSLVPLLTAPQKKLSHRMKFYFQEIFNSFANKKIK